jgi:hypothetical protein
MRKYYDCLPEWIWLEKNLNRVFDVFAEAGNPQVNSALT